MELKEIPNKIRNMDISISESLDYFLRDVLRLSELIGEIYAYALTKNVKMLNDCIVRLEDYISEFENYGCLSEETITTLKDLLSVCKEDFEKKQYEGIVEFIYEPSDYLIEIEFFEDFISVVKSEIIESIAEELEYQLSKKQ
jgi:hypothetical protein